jgi:hypothetical protein
MFADAFLGQEAEINPPSTASGGNEFDPERIMWLVERRRPTTVTHYSGTLLHHSKKKDLRSSTIFTFAHFVFGHSNGQMVFADIQGLSFLPRNIINLPFYRFTDISKWSGCFSSL